MRRWWSAILCAFGLSAQLQFVASAGEPPSSLLFAESFEDPQLLDRGWYDGRKFVISDRQPFAGKGCLEYAWQSGGTTPSSSSGIRHLFEPTDVVALRCYIRLSKGWGWSGRSYHPHLMHFMTTENSRFHGPAASHLTVYIEPCNGKLRLAAQDIQNKDQLHGLTQGPLRGGYNGTMYDSKEVLFDEDRWHCVEALFQLNTLDAKADKPNADGIVRGWFDGRLVIDHTNAVLRSTDFPRMQFNQFLLTPYFGPGLLPHEQTLWIDEVAVGTRRVGEAKTARSAEAPNHSLEYIDTSFENASPVWYDLDPDGTVMVYLLYDHERSSPNRAAGHIHFRLHAKTGSRLKLEFKNLDNVWNGTPGSIARELKTVVISEDGRQWKSVPLESLPGDRVRLQIDMTGPQMYVARVEPYRLSDLEKFLAEIRASQLVRIETIGQTVQGRPLELLTVGRDDAAFRVFLRARAHPWESGGNWVVEGLVRRLLRGDADAESFLKRYCVYILPMANKDGVALGRTRFNLQGKDLNRDWDKPADAKLSPENHSLERWLEGMIGAGRPAHLALELHNDGAGKLHISRPPVPGLERHLKRMANLEELLRRHTWFTEGSTGSSFRNSGTLGDGWLERYHIDAAVHEFHCNWIAGLNDYPSAKHWQAYGEKLATVFHEYFGVTGP